MTLKPAPDTWKFIGLVPNGGQVFLWEHTDLMILVTEDGQPFIIECALDGFPVFHCLDMSAGSKFGVQDIDRWFGMARGNR